MKHTLLFTLGEHTPNFLHASPTPYSKLLLQDPTALLNLKVLGLPRALPLDPCSSQILSRNRLHSHGFHYC